ncbi:hypothetical protein NDN08_002440 [Rhodosorus marinus]|uniref:Sodium/hydrogen exchanger n=1 Tax=Rhodosorus marinus TaxID=101924 RepID=A0AAV8UTS2_9RHOD|nr:hypothetical protein NDN08_002440 [Rhodosorus marinus]
MDGDGRDESMEDPGSWSQKRQAYLPVAIAFLALVLFALALIIATKGSRPSGCPSCNCAGEFDPDIGLLTQGGSEEESQNELGFGLAIFIMTLSFCIVASFLISEHSFFNLPDCLSYVFIGIMIGLILRLSGISATAGYALPNQEQFFLFIIPPIIFEAGYSLSKADFFRQSGSILVFAVVGTIITALFWGLGMYLLGTLAVSYKFRLWEALTFGALVSAVDPVATLAIFNALKVNRTLHYLVFGESVVNDAVAIVLYHTFAQMIGSSRPHWYVPIFSFVYIFAGSVVIGVLTSALAALILKHLSLSKQPTLELAFYMLMAYVPYFMCEGFGMSGIMGILTGGVLLAHYAHPNLSTVTQISSNYCFKSIAYLTETFVFVYLGTALTTFNHSWDSATVAFAIVLTLASRAANIFPLSRVVNKYRGNAKIDAKNQFIMWFSGLRGAIAFALSLNFPGGNEVTRRVVISTTLAIVLFTVIVLGGGTLPILQLLRVEGAATASKNQKHVSHLEGRDMDTFAAGQEHPTPDEGRKGWLERMDEIYFKPWLTNPADAANQRSTAATFQRLANLSGEGGEALTPHHIGSMFDGLEEPM